MPKSKCLRRKNILLCNLSLLRPKIAQILKTDFCKRQNWENIACFNHFNFLRLFANKHDLKLSVSLK